MDIILCRRKRSFAASILRFFMMTGASHSALHDTERREVFDASFMGRGVRPHDEAAFFAEYITIRRIHVEVPPQRMAAARVWLDEQLGKPYDWRCVFGLALRRSWQDEEAWHCSELTEAFRSKFGRARFRADAWRITSHHQDITL